MAQLQRGDRVVLQRQCKGLNVGSTGVITRVIGGIRDMQGTALLSADYYRVRWDSNCLTEGERTRDHKGSSLRAEGDSPAAPTSLPQLSPVPQPTGVSKKLALLQFDDADAGLNNILEFSNDLREIATTARRLRALQNSVRHVALYQGPELNLYLTIKGKEVHLVKEVDGALQQAVSVPLQVFARLVESLRSEST